MRNCNWLLLLCVVLITNALADWESPYYQDHPLVGKVYSLNDTAWVSIGEMHKELLNSQIILLGETHTNADHHIGQANVIQYFIDQGESVALYWEMLPHEGWEPDKSVGHDLETLLIQLKEQAKGWEWDIYTPILKLSLKHDLPLNGANLTKQERTNYTQPDECEIIRNQQKLEFCDALSVEKIDYLKQLIFAAHCEYLPLEHTDPLVNTQIAKDAAFALNITQSRDMDKVILIAGKNHVRKDIGVPVHLQQLGETSNSIAFVAVDPERTHLNDYLKHEFEDQYDYMVFTPSDRNQDPCIEFAEKLKKFKK
ncbi:MAG: ChaN family lipoprotein [Pseudomonadota bacterium]